MVQSMGIVRHVARKHGLYGKNNAEMARVEEARRSCQPPHMTGNGSRPAAGSCFLHSMAMRASLLPPQEWL